MTKNVVELLLTRREIDEVAAYKLDVREPESVDARQSRRDVRLGYVDADKSRIGIFRCKRDDAPTRTAADSKTRAVIGGGGVRPSNCAIMAMRAG